VFEGPALTARGLRLLPARDADAPFLRSLFETARPDAAILAAWPDEIRRPFLDQQFRFQTTHYTRVYPEADRLLITVDGTPIGRIILSREAEAWCLVDIALVPARRGQGFGTLLMQSIQAAARRARTRCVRLTVDMHNPARRLYERLGFRVEEESIPAVAMSWRTRGIS
jgi:ribosomal protein S18 acetylase RimI-like enzyme